MRLPCIVLAALLGMAGAAHADCDSQTATLDTATVVFKCGNGVVTPDPSNILTVEKQPAPPPEPDVVETPVPSQAEQVQQEVIPQPAAKIASPKPKQAKTKSSKSRRAWTKPAKSPRAKKPARKNRIIHLEKPTMGRRVLQFLGL